MALSLTISLALAIVERLVRHGIGEGEAFPEPLP